MNRRLLVMLSVTALLMAAASSVAQQTSVAKPPYTEKQAIDYAKAADVNQLDASLSHQSLVDWLRNGPPHVDRLDWEFWDTCQIHPTPSIPDYPLCVMAKFVRGGQWGQLLVLLGTRRKGVIGPPQLYEGAQVWDGNFVNSGSATRLSELPPLLAQPAVTPGVSEFYAKIAKLHLLGIPNVADKKVIGRYLSARLLQQLETAQSCQNDYLRQHPHAESSTQPAWMTSDLFAGENDSTASFFVNTVHKQPLSHGAFAVTVDVTEVDTSKKPNNIIAGGIPAYAVKSSWPAIAIVIPENEHYLIDDIRIFDGDSTDGPSRLLSTSFFGCDGPLWTGEPAATKPQEAPPSPTHYVDWDAVNRLRSAAYKEEVAFAQSVDVHQLDPLLPSGRLESWLKSPSIHAAHISWSALQCNIQEGRDGATPTPERGLCASVIFDHGNASARIEIAKGGKEASTIPVVKKIEVEDKDQDLLSTFTNENVKKNSNPYQLSELLQLLTEQSVIDVTRNLYDSLIANHPLGIPHGDEMGRLRPLISARLLKALEATRLCQVESARRNPSSAEKPGWLHTGLFSGNGKSALPTAALVTGKEKQEDGSFLVLVWLSHKENAASPENFWTTWPIQVIVKSELGRFVIDDVRIFEKPSLAGPSHMLTDSFSGCDMTATKK